MVASAVLLVFLAVCVALCDGKVSSRWKTCSAERQASFAAKDAELQSFLKSSLPAALEHTGDTNFDEHLIGVQAILRNWGADEHVCSAGLMHSIYGTEGFQGFKLPLTNRAALRNLLSAPAERLVWIFCMVDRASVDQVVSKEMEGPPSETMEFRSRVELGSFPIALTKQEFLDFIELVLADWLEQVEGASEKENALFGWKVGDAWSYRRVAYEHMAALLAARVERLRGVADAMHAQVYAQEPPETKALHMALTPPMSQAAREAREALASRDW